MTTQVRAVPAQIAASPWWEEFRLNANLTRELAWTQFKLKYTGSVLGYVWSLLKPMLLFSVMYTIFVVLFRQRANDFPVQLLVGIVLYTFFTDTVSTGMGAIAGNAHLIRKAYFPRSILVISSSLTASMTFLINLTLIVAITTPIGQLHPGVRSLAVIPLVAELMALALGMAFILSALFVFYRDLGHIWEIFSQVLFYASAVVYPASLVPGHWRALFFINPVAQVIEDIRHALVISAAPWTGSLVGIRVAIPIAISVGVLVTGITVFRKLTPSFAENL
jgi:ABC-2 type transport system permease protein